MKYKVSGMFQCDVEADTDVEAEWEALMKIKAKKVRRQLERIALESEYKINTESDNYENRDQ